MRTVKCAERSKHTTFHFHLRPSELETVTKPYKPKWARQNCTYNFSEVNHKETSLATCHQLSLWKNSEEIFVNMSSQRVDARPRGSQTKFDSHLVKGFQETDLAGHPSSERAIRCANRNFESLSSQASIGNKVFAITNVCFICTTMSRQLGSS